MDILYRSEPRPDTGLYNAKLAMWLFLATEVMFFGALYSSYVFLRIAGADWPQGAQVLPLNMSFLNLLALIGAAACSAQAWAVLRVDRGERPWLWLAGMSLCGVLSVMFIVIEHRLVANTGVTAATSNFYGMYYLLSGLQRIHVIAGILLSVYYLVLGQRLLLKDATRYLNHMECLALYWQLVLLLWVTFLLMFVVF